jgi:hypothetical protein
MVAYEAVIAVVASPARVFEVLRDVEHWSDWTPTMLSIRRLDFVPFGVGSRALVHQPRLMPATWEGTGAVALAVFDSVNVSS